MSMIAITVLTFVATIIALYPLFRGESRPAMLEVGDPAVENLLSQRESIYSAIKDLEFDQAQGKLSVADYQDLRSKYEAKAIAVLQQLQAAGRFLKQEPGWSSTAGSQCPECGASLSRGDRFCRACGHSFAARCAGCGARLADADRFCRQCGTTVPNSTTA